MATGVKNFQLWQPVSTINNANSADVIPHVENDAHRAFRYAIPLQLERIRQDVTTWRTAIREAENAYMPHRFRMQQLFVDKILEGHTKSCLDKRTNLTLQKTFCIGTMNSEGKWVRNAEATKLFESKKWFRLLLTEIINAQYYGYSLVQLGDLVVKGKDYRFTNIMPIRRWLVSPDRLNYVQLPYQISGLDFLNDSIVDENGVPYADWMLWVDTPSDTGASPCGYGLLYDVALYAIILRNNLAHNADFNQNFVAPYRHLKTDEKEDSEEYQRLFDSALNMANNGFVLTDKQTEIEFVNGGKTAGFQSYESLEERCQKLISKRILGHANAMDAQNTALGGSSAGMDILKESGTPEGMALKVTEQVQNEFVLSVLNDTFYQKLQKLGFPLKDGEQFYIANDDEEFETRLRTDASNKQTADIAVAMKQAGLQMDAKYFEERTGIPTTEAPAPVPGLFSKQSFAENRKRIKAMYDHNHTH